MLRQPTDLPPCSPRKRPSEWRCFRPTRSACFRTMESMAFNCFSSFRVCIHMGLGTPAWGRSPRRSSLLRILATPPHQALPSVHPGGGVLIAGALRPEYGLVRSGRSGLAASFGYATTHQLIVESSSWCSSFRISRARAAESAMVPSGRLRSKSNSTCCISLVAHKATLELEPSSPFVATATLAWRAFGMVLFKEPPLFWLLAGPAYWLPWALGALAVEAHLGRIRLPRNLLVANLLRAAFCSWAWHFDPPPPLRLYRWLRSSASWPLLPHSSSSSTWLARWSGVAGGGTTFPRTGRFSRRLVSSATASTWSTPWSFELVKQALISLQVPVGAVLPLRLFVRPDGRIRLLSPDRDEMDRALAETIGTGYPA